MSNLSGDLVDAVTEHAETILTRGRDRYGPKHTPLLVDALNPDTLDPVAHDGRDVAGGRRLSNFALQQEFLRALVALSTTTRESRYRDAAVELVEYAFERLTDAAGLLQWGGHVAYDVDADELATNKGGPHELKFEYPFYEFLWEVDAEATRRFVEAFWTAHVFDWSILDFNRHGDLNEWLNDEYDYAEEVDEAVADPWDREYEGGDVFFWGSGLTFVNTGSDLYYAAGMLADLGGDDDPLSWAERLALRYVETRGETGISGYQFSQHPSYCDGPQVRGDRAQYQFAPYVHGDHDIYEGTLFRPRPIVQRRQLELGERLGDRGSAFAEWAVEELRAWREAAYRPEENEFEPMLTDGLSLEGFVIRRPGYFGPQGRIIGPIDADADFLWTYALAARVAGDEVCRETARDVAAGLGLVDADSGPEAGAERVTVRTDTDLADYRAIYGLLELHRATGRETYLDAAGRVGRNVLDERFDGDAFVADGRVTPEDGAPLALLHLAAALDGADRDALPTPVGDRRTPEGGV